MKRIQSVLSPKINVPVTLAPMVGLSHRPLRKLIRRYLPPTVRTWWPTEMLNSRRLPHENVFDLPELSRDPDEDLICPQILANEQEPIARSIKKLEAWGAFAIDINMGCPVTRALKHNYGVALMGDPEYAAQVIRWGKEAASVPISVKLRAGFERDIGYLRSFISKLVEAGVDWVTLHPRLAHEARRGRADWELLRKIRGDFSVPLIGNGDVQTVEDIIFLLEEGYCDGVMIGRALVAKPWLLAKVAQRLGFPSTVPLPQGEYEEAQEYLACLRQLLRELRLDYPSGLVMRKFQFYLRMTHMWLDFGLKFYGDCMSARDSDHLDEILFCYGQRGELRMAERTDLVQ